MTVVNYYYVTTPIYYANGHPHLGNTYTTTLGDCLTRFHKFLGEKTFFLTGTDEHGDKVHEAALKAGKTPEAFTAEVAELFKRTWKELDLEYSCFIRTTEPQHKKLVCEILQKIFDKGEIYFGEYGGNYCVGCERFLTDKEIVDGKCPDHQTPVQFVKEQNYFFKMEPYRERLLAHIAANSDFIRPERYKNEVLGLLREPLDDLCISRPKSRLQWGIELPFDKNYVTYVWFDALINYLTGIEYPNGKDFKNYWGAAEHLIAKDILKPHAVFWPTMLMSAGIPLYKHLNVHGYWITPTGKMSKSLGNVVDPVAIKNQYGMDVFRYVVLRDMTFGLDGTFSTETLEARYSADLANNLGNLVSRTLAMTKQYRDGKVPAQSKLEEIDAGLRDECVQMVSDVKALMLSMEIHRALERLWNAIVAVNVYIDRTKPWALAKEEKASGSTTRLDTVLYCQLEAIRIIGGILAPFMPDTSAKILAALNAPATPSLKTVAQWGGLKTGQPTIPPEPLFPRLESKKKGVETVDTNSSGTPAAEPKAPAPKTVEPTGLIAYADFAKVQLRVGQIMAAENVAKSEKLLRLQVDVGDGEGKTRQIVAGIAKHYAADSLIGRKVTVVTNLQPAKLMGVESHGMLLAASDDSGNLELVSPGAIFAPGAIIK